MPSLSAPAWRCPRRQDFVAHSWPKRRSDDWLNHAERTRGQSQKHLQTTAFSDVRRRAAWCPTRPVPPEVAGSSPVASVKSPAKWRIVLSAQTPDLGRLHKRSFERGRNGGKRAATPSKCHGFEPNSPESRPTANMASNYTKHRRSRLRGRARALRRGEYSLTGVGPTGLRVHSEDRRRGFPLRLPQRHRRCA
jgi:hypothetical protein